LVRFLAWTHPGAEPKLGKKHTQDWSAYTEDDTAVIRRRCDWPGAEALVALQVSHVSRNGKKEQDSASPATPQKHSWMRCSHLKQTH
jgi:hypothetical protein